MAKNEIRRVATTSEHFYITATDINDMNKIKEYLHGAGIGFDTVDDKFIIVDSVQVVHEMDEVEKLLSKNNQPVNTESKHWKLVEAYYEHN